MFISTQLLLFQLKLSRHNYDQSLLLKFLFQEAKELNEIGLNFIGPVFCTMRTKKTLALMELWWKRN